LRPVLAFSLFAATVLPVVVLACGGAAPSALLTSYSPTDTEGADGSAPADATTHTGSPDAMQTPTDDSGEDDVAIGPMEAGPVDAAQVEAAPESGPSPGLACTNGTMKVYCQGSDTCCLTGGVLSTASCGSSTTCLGSTVRCASSADCMMGQVCCSTAEQIGFSTTYSVSCASTCTGLGKTELCDPGGGPGGCPNGQTCSASTDLPGYSQCP
jgi:hypothetical protein